MSGINVNSETWEIVSAKVRARIERMRDELEAEDNPETRGMLRFAREVLKFPESEQPAPVVTSGDYI